MSIRGEGNSNENVHSPSSVKTMKSNKCKLIDWFGSGEVIAKGTRISSDPKELVHHALLGLGAVKVSVDVVKKQAFLWRPNAEMATIEEALSSYMLLGQQIK